MSNTSKPVLLRGSGRVKVAVYDAITDLRGPWRQVGNVPSLKLDPKVAMIEHREDMTGYRFKDARFTDTADLSIAFTMENFAIENLSMAIFGDVASDDGTGTYTTVIAGGVLPGFDYDFGGARYTVTSITASDNTVVPPSDYLVNSDGTVTFKVAHPLDLTVTGNKAASTTTTILTRQTPVIALRFEGLNTADSRSPVIVTIPRIGLNPAKGIDFIGTQFSKLEMDGDALYDPNLVSAGILTNIMNGYGSITLA